MDDSLYQRARGIFDAVADLPRSQRDAALAAACGADEPLRVLVAELLSFDDAGSDVGRMGEAMAAVWSEGDAATSPVPLQPGVCVDRYQVLRLLGVGGTAQVWEVQHRTLGTRFALKVLTWADPGLQRRLLREARTQARLEHPNIVPVHDIVNVNGAPGLLMALIEGPALDELLAAARPTTDEAISLLRGAALGVAHAHAHGFAHRDLKPGNILIDLRDGRLIPRVADFGLVKDTRDRTLTRQGSVLGTLAYAAPEQLANTADAGPPADLWSLGIILYEMVCGARPFRAESLADIAEQHRRGPDLAPLPPSLRPIVSQLLSVRPGDRPESCDALLDSLPASPTLRDDAPLGAAALALARAHAAALPSAEPPRAETWHPDGNTTGDFLLESTPPSLNLPAPAPASAAWLRPAPVMGLIAGLGLLVAGGVGWRSTAGPATPATVSVPEVPEPTPTPAIEVLPPEPVPEPTSEPEPEPEPEPAPAQPVTRPAPAPAPVVVPAPEPEPAPEPAVIRVVGNAERVRVISSDGQIHAPGSVPPGRYTFEAWLPNRGVPAQVSLGDIASGAAVTVRCDDEFGMCSQVP